MDPVSDVNTGEVKVAGPGFTLRSSAIGSCVVVVAFDAVRRLGGMVHVMVPGECMRKDDEDRTRYARDGIETMFAEMIDSGASMDRIQACMVGGGNVLRRADDTIAEDNINSVLDILTAKNIPIMARSLGGFERRSVSFDIDRSSVLISIGSGPIYMLYNYNSTGPKGEFRHE